ncbi:nucleolar protein 58-like [Dendronephthya gigantea]|uniref:nucleolar protein 58-like n=1 Tax=Dendronephthya gigantea TaxID=151771 RepID=UPI00106C0C1A|nr:nucleolar protein 58-like [Dendronephthya gigantea]
MLVLFETPAGYAIFKLLDEGKLQKADNLYEDFESPERAHKILKLKHFEKFNDTTDALAAATAAVEGKMSKSLKKVLKKIVSKDLNEKLAVADAKLGSSIKEKLNLNCFYSSAIQELMRGIRSQMNNLLTGLPESDISSMALGLAHSLSRYKLKFSPDKVDTMIVQAISLLDDLDKELNNYVMRCREWYGWHFPEFGKIVTDNLVFAKAVKKIGLRTNIQNVDLSDTVPEDIEDEVKAAAEISMGTEISEEDIENILYLCDQVIEISDYRAQLYDYLKNRMTAIAPNLTVLVGELVGARLIAHAGSLVNLAKHPSSTVQILGAEKALFRALKTKHDTPKYGLIYHASLVGQSNAKNKGKVSRMLAAKASLAARVDALGEDSNVELGMEIRAKVESRVRALEDGQLKKLSGTGKSVAKSEKYVLQSEIKGYNPASDSTLPTNGKKRKHEETVDTEETNGELEDEIEEKQGKKEKKKKKKEKKVKKDQTIDEAEIEPPSSEKKKKKAKKETND